MVPPKVIRFNDAAGHPLVARIEDSGCCFIGAKDLAHGGLARIVFPSRQAAENAMLHLTRGIKGVRRCDCDHSATFDHCTCPHEEQPFAHDAATRREASTEPKAESKE